MTDLKNDGSFLRKIYFPALFPNIIAVLGGTINVFFDGILVGQKLGDIGLQAVNQSLPIYLILCTIGSLLASGASILSSVAFGKEDKKEAQRIFNGTLWMSMLVSVAVCVIGFIFSSGISSIISTPETYEYVLTYVRITVIGGIFKMAVGNNIGFKSENDEMLMNKSVGAIIAEADGEMPWCDTIEGEVVTTYRTLIDSAGNTMPIRTLSTCEYALEKMPKNEISVIGIIDYADNRYFLRIVNKLVI